MGIEFYTKFNDSSGLRSDFCIGIVFALGVAILSVGTGCSTSQSRAVASKEERAALLIAAANGAMIEGDRVSVFSYLKAAEELDPRNARIYHLRALAFLEKKDRDSAGGQLQKAIALAPLNSMILNTYGKFLYDVGQLDLAEKHLKKAAIDPTFAEAYKSLTILGMIEEKRKNQAKAIEYYDRAVLENSSLACVAYSKRSRLKALDGKMNAAERDLEKASSGMCSQNLEGKLALGDFLEKKQETQKARAHYLEIQQISPESPQAEEALKRLQRLPPQ